MTCLTYLQLIFPHSDFYKQKNINNINNSSNIPPATIPIFVIEKAKIVKDVLDKKNPTTGTPTISIIASRL